VSTGLYSGVSGLALGTGLYKGTLGLWGGASGLINQFGATLALNFLTGEPLDSRITFTRSTTATFVGSDGLIQSSAINTPRFDYNPATLAARGLLIEEQRVNLLLNSDILGTNLSTQSVTVTAQSYTISFYGTGTITLAGAAVQVVTGTGAYPSRRTLTFTPTAGVLVCTVTGTVQFAQLEAGAFATSFIPTAGSTVTRAADNAVMTGTNFSSWYNASEGTIVISADSFRGTGGAARTFVFNDGTSSNNIRNGGQSTLQVVDAGVTQASIAGTPLIPFDGTVFKFASAYKLNDFATVTTGAVATDTSGTVPNVNQLLLGSGETSTTYLNGHLRTFTYYAYRLTNAQLQALTA